MFSRQRKLHRDQFPRWEDSHMSSHAWGKACVISASRVETLSKISFKYRRIDAFELWCWRILLRVPWTARRSNQSILKEINPEYSLEGLMLKLKLQ